MRGDEKMKKSNAGSGFERRRLLDRGSGKQFRVDKKKQSGVW